jgi:hypothetical protein
MIEPELLEAYVNTTYEVFYNEKIIKLRITEYNFEIDKLLDKHGSKSWVFITACNPHSKKLTETENNKRQAELLTDLNGYKTFPGTGKPDDEQWDPEISVLVLDLSDEILAKLAKKYSQNAVVIGYQGQAPELVFFV